MPMTRTQAERLLQLNPDLQSLGANRDQAITKLMQLDAAQMPGGSMAAVNPRGAIQAALAAAPAVVTPASPAPMKPGVPVMAPRPEAKQLPQPAVGGPVEKARAVTEQPREEEKPAETEGYKSPLRVASKATEAELKAVSDQIDELKANDKPIPPELAMDFENLRRRYFALETRVIADEAAQIDPERAKLLAQQEGRLKGEEERLARDKKETIWDAALKGSLAMLNPQKGANFLASLGGGLGTGLEAYEAARSEQAERKARLGQSFDQLAAQRIDALDKARAAARNAITEGEQIDERTLRMANLTDEAIVDAGTQQARIDKAVADATEAKVKAQYAPALLQSEIDLRGAQAFNYRNPDRGGGGDGSPTPTSTFKAQKDAEKKASDLRIKAAKAFATWKENTPSGRGLTTEQSGPEWDSYNAIRQEYRYWRDMAGRKSPYKGKQKTVNFEDL